MNDGVLERIERRLDDIAQEMKELNRKLDEKAEPEIRADQIVEVLKALDEVEIK